MFKKLLIVLTVLAFAVTGCENADPTQQEGVNSAASSPAGEIAETSVIEILPEDLEVGQWIEYGSSDSPQTIMFAVVDSEDYMGTECLWLQISSAEQFVAQILLDPSCLDEISEYSVAEFRLFMDAPTEYIRAKLQETENTADIFLQPEYRELIVDYIEGLKIVKFESNGDVMAFDLTGVADFAEEQMNSPEMMEGIQQEFDGQDQAYMDSVLAELDELEFTIDDTEVSVNGEILNGYVITVDAPDGSATVSLSPELPILPLASATIDSPDESISMNVVDYGFDGAVNLLPEMPEQTIPVMMFLQGMAQQFEQGSGSSVK